MVRMMAIVERELRRFFRSPALMMASMVFPLVQLVVLSIVAMAAMAALGALIARYLVLPLSGAPALNTLLITLMLGTVLREGVRLGFPDGSNPKPFPALLPTTAYTFGHFTLRLDSLMLLAAGLAIGLRARTAPRAVPHVVAATAK